MDHTQPEFLSKNTREATLSTLNAALISGVDFKLSRPTIKYRPQQDIKGALLEPLPIEGTPLDDVIGKFQRDVVEGSVNFSSPGFMAFPDAGNSIAALAGAVYADMLNQNLINSEHTSPTATFVELATVRWLRQLVGYKCPDAKDITDAGGINVPGGVMANTVSILLAREHRFPSTLRDGITYDPRRVKVYLPEGISHYSCRASMGWIGLGHANAVPIPTTNKFMINQKALVDRIEADISDGNTPLAVIAYAGDSRTMAIDDFPALRRIADKYQCWFHVDACHGFSLCFSDKLKEKVRGMELADSITLDPHKVLWLPYNLSYVLTRDPSGFKSVAGVSDLITKEPYSFGQITPFLGSRAFNSAKLWFLLKHLGVKRIGELIEQRHALAVDAGIEVEKDYALRLMSPVRINSVAFAYAPKAVLERGREYYNQLTRRIHRRIWEDGDYYIHTFSLPDRANVLGYGIGADVQVLRIMPGNPLTTIDLLRDALGAVKRTGKEETDV
jgi:L-2,4-diaminobutyrate decarboxylase